MNHIETQHFILRPLQEHDAICFLQELPKVDSLLSIIAPKNIDEAKAMVHKYVVETEKGESIRFVIEKRDSKEFVGIVGVDDLQTDEPERHCWIKKDEQGKGIAFEVITQFMKWANESLPYKVMYSSFSIANTAMKKLNEKLGGELVSDVPVSYLQDSGKMLQDVIRYTYRNPNR